MEGPFLRPIGWNTMFSINHSSVQNLLLTALPPLEFNVLQPHLEWVDLRLRVSLSGPNEPIKHAYFPTEGICSIIAVNPAGVRIETGIIGKEGFVGSPIILLVDHAPYEVIVQAEGRALRISRRNLLLSVEKCPAFNALLLRFIHNFMVQTAHSALANGHHTIEERLARWLLMCHDRIGANEFVMTHQFLAIMLAVRRSGVTEALHMLEGQNIIQSTRGRIEILNRKRLEKAAGGSYGVPEQEYERLISPMRQPAAIKHKS